MNQTKILLVGIGGYGENYVKELLAGRDASVRLEGICDPFAGRCPEYPQIMARAIPVYDSIGEFYQSHRADLAVISTPIHLHSEQTIACLIHGSNVLCEKPLCVGMSEAEAMLAAQQKSGRWVAVGYQLAYSRDVQALKRDILGGRFGRPVGMKAFHTARRGAAYYGRNDWAGRIARGGTPVYDSPLNNACAHQFQNMLFLLGPAMNRSADVRSVEAQLYRGNPHIDNFDTIALRCRTDRGFPVYYYTSHAVEAEHTGPVSEYRFENATVFFGRGGVSEYEVDFPDGRHKTYAGISKGDRLQKLYDSIACTRSHTGPVCTIETAIPHIRCVEMAQKNRILPVAATNLKIWKEGEDTFYSIRDAESLLQECYDRSALPKDLGIHWE